MTYASGGLISASDYNGLVGGNPSTSSGVYNTIWATGNGDRGYGQSPLSQAASVGADITATQWTTFINAINNLTTHQTGSSAGLSTVAAGDLITYTSSITTALTNLYTNRFSHAANGTTTTGSVFSPGFSVGNTYAAQSFSMVRTITWPSADACRYFYNAGGYLNFVTTSVANNDGSTRSADWCTLVGSNIGNITGIAAYTNSGRSGSGGTLNTNNTGIGYWNSSTTYQTLVSVTSTGYTYTGDYALIQIKNSAANAGSNSDNGYVQYIYGYLYSAAHDSIHQWNQTINITWNHRIDVVYPSTTYLTNTWYSPTIT